MRNVPLLALVLCTVASGAIAQGTVTNTKPGDIVAVNIDPDTHVIRIREIWNGRTSDDVRLLFSHFSTGSTWTIEKTVVNNLQEWIGFSHTLYGMDGKPLPWKLDPKFPGANLNPHFSGTPTSDMFSSTSQTSANIDYSNGQSSRGGIVKFTYTIQMGDLISPFENAPDFILSETALAAAPEVSTWVLMILGFGAVGGMLRHRRQGQPSLER